MIYAFSSPTLGV